MVPEIFFTDFVNKKSHLFLNLQYKCQLLIFRFETEYNSVKYDYLLYKYHVIYRMSFKKSFLPMFFCEKSYLFLNLQ